MLRFKSTSSTDWHEVIKTHRRAIEQEIIKAMRRSHHFGAYGYVVDVIVYEDGTTAHIVKASKNDSIKAVYDGEACDVCTVECYDLSEWYDCYTTDELDEMTEAELEQLKNDFFSDAATEIGEQIERFIDEAVEFYGEE